MPIEQVPGSDLRYYLIAFDAEGREREDDPDGRLSRRAAESVEREPITDVFLMSHGWRGDLPSAKKQYNEWIGAMLACTDDQNKMRAARPEFRPLLVGLHWPSEPWGDEELGGGGGAMGPAAAPPVQSLIDRYAARLADTPAVREALQTIFDAMRDDPAPVNLPLEVRAAYDALNHETGLGSAGPGAPPGDDREPFDAEGIYQDGQNQEGELATYGEFQLGSVFLLPLRLLSFWKMKDRGRQVGESGGHTLLNSLQQAAAKREAQAGGRVRFHLMGHSFGCVVVSSALAGPYGRTALHAPVDSLVLVQGALSCWSYCSQIPSAPDRAGYFRSIVTAQKVRGPIITTQSQNDTAVGRHYPNAAGVRGQVSYAPGQQLPKYGAVGTFGLRGPGVESVDLDLFPADEPYFFESGKVYNLEGSQVIRQGRWPCGAHGDIAHPEVAHAVWEAAWASERLLSFNGVNCSRGTYLMPPRSAGEISALAKGEEFDPADLRALRWRHTQAEAHYGVKAGVDPRNLAEAGWGIIFAHGADPAIREALAPLLAHRKAQAAQQNERRYQEYVGEKGYRPGETKDQFLVRHGSSPGAVDPDRMPYYLLIVGDPETIPFSFQAQLDVANAVGRIQFDSPEEYANYARSVVEAETQGLALPRRATFFGTQNPADEPTSLSANHLVKPLAEWVAKNHAAWKVETVLKTEATKARLHSLLGGPETPALLFTATHGACFDPGDPRQRAHQGALICQDWPGPFSLPPGQPVPQEFYLPGEEIGDDARLLGLLTFHFACYGAGTPRLDEFTHRELGKTERETIASHAFIAGLPKRLLGHQKGGALAVVGHVERAWGCSYTWGGLTREQLTTFESTLKWLLEGYPVGAALDFFNQKYADLSTSLSKELEDINFGKQSDDFWMAELWTANNDARGYAIIGDPAVRLPAAANGEVKTERPVITAVAPRPAPPPPPAADASPLAAASDGPAQPIPVGPPAPTSEPVAQRADAEAAAPAPPPFDWQRLAERLGRRLEEAVGDDTSITVSTYVSDDLSRVRPEEGGISGARLRALTRIGPAGDIQLCVSAEAGEVDAVLWARHVDMVQRAQAHRAELLRVALEATSGRLRAPDRAQQ